MHKHLTDKKEEIRSTLFSLSTFFPGVNPGQALIKKWSKKSRLQKKG
jgi:hypothetical protein